MTKNTNTLKATRTVYTILRQISTLVPRGAYLDFSFLNGLASRDIFFVVRKKTNTQFKVVESLKPSRAPDPKKQSTQILADEKVQYGRALSGICF